MCGRAILLPLLAIVSAPCRVTDIVDMVDPITPVLARSTKLFTRSGCFDGVYTVRGMRSVLYPLDCECGSIGGRSTVCLEAVDEALEMDERVLLTLFQRLGCSCSLHACTFLGRGGAGSSEPLSRTVLEPSVCEFAVEEYSLPSTPSSSSRTMLMRLLGRGWDATLQCPTLRLEEEEEEDALERQVVVVLARTKVRL